MSIERLMNEFDNGLTLFQLRQRHADELKKARTNRDRAKISEYHRRDENHYRTWVQVREMMARSDAIESARCD